MNIQLKSAFFGGGNGRTKRLPPLQFSSISQHNTLTIAFKAIFKATLVTMKLLTPSSFNTTVNLSFRFADISILIIAIVCFKLVHIYIICVCVRIIRFAANFMLMKSWINSHSHRYSGWFLIKIRFRSVYSMRVYSCMDVCFYAHGRLNIWISARSAHSIDVRWWINALNSWS